MTIRYRHTNIVANDWDALARFYEDVFGCVREPPEREHAGEWLERGTGVPDAHIRGVHLRLPGFGADGPTLEIFTYAENLAKPATAANREGFAHLAFEVDDVKAALARILDHGGNAVGDVITHDVPGVGRLVFAYATDPEGNILEIQRWSSAP